MWPFRKQKNASLISWLNAIEEGMKYTPDMWLLDKCPKWNVFVYSNEQTGHPQHKLLEGAERRGIAYTATNFAVWRKNLGKESFAVALDNSWAPPKDQGWDKPKLATLNRLRGEVFTVPKHIILSVLDKNKQNTVQFIRRRVSLIVRYKLTIDDTPPSFEKRTQTPKYIPQGLSGPYESIVTAWMYVGNPAYWNDQITVKDDIFSPAHLLKPREDRPLYYAFDKVSYEE